MEVIKFEVEDEETGEYVEIDLPAKFVVCHRCEGRGKHTNPNIDGNGLTREDFENDPDFYEDYRSGVYDVTCELCKGKNVVLAVDETRCDKTLLLKYYRSEEQKAQWDYEDRHTRYMESGGYDG